MNLGKSLVELASHPQQVLNAYPIYDLQYGYQPKFQQLKVFLHFAGRNRKFLKKLS